MSDSQNLGIARGFAAPGRSPRPPRAAPLGRTAQDRRALSPPRRASACSTRDGTSRARSSGSCSAAHAMTASPRSRRFCVPTRRQHVAPRPASAFPLQSLATETSVSVFRSTSKADVCGGNRGKRLRPLVPAESKADKCGEFRRKCRPSFTRPARKQTFSARTRWARAKAFTAPRWARTSASTGCYTAPPPAPRALVTEYDGPHIPRNAPSFASHAHRPSSEPGMHRGGAQRRSTSFGRRDARPSGSRSAVWLRRIHARPTRPTRRKRPTRPMRPTRPTRPQPFSERSTKVIVKD